ncbi:hypothetical protein AYI69_g9668, partial [Smittium culicis]
MILNEEGTLLQFRAIGLGIHW